MWNPIVEPASRRLSTGETPLPHGDSRSVISRRIGGGLAAGAAAAALAVALAGCGDAARDRIQRFFFDVPPATASSADSGAPAARGRDAWGRRRARTIETRFASRHPPFLRRQCASCHDARAGFQPFQDVRGVCAECHADVVAPRAVVHGPSASGACCFCHDPHRAPLPKLLHDRDPQLCLSCHEMTGFPECSGRRSGVVAGCLPCHEPHGADEPYLLKPRSAWNHLLDERADPTPLHGGEAVKG
jgi:predicted CXXCH cytochrome family protein